MSSITVFEASIWVKSLIDNLKKDKIRK